MGRMARNPYRGRKKPPLPFAQRVKFGILMHSRAMKAKDVAFVTKRSEKTVRDWKKLDLSLPDAIFHTDNINKLHMRRAAFPAIEQALLYYVQLHFQRLGFLPLTQLALQRQAVIAARHFGVGPGVFQASNGWFRNFCRRCRISSHVFHGEGGDVRLDPADVDDLKALVARYPPELVINADQSGLFYQQLPHSGFVTEEDAVAMRGYAIMHSKERVTMHTTTNATGTMRWPIVVVGKAKNPVIFQVTPVRVLHC